MMLSFMHWLIYQVVFTYFRTPHFSTDPNAFDVHQEQNTKKSSSIIQICAVVMQRKKFNFVRMRFMVFQGTVMSLKEKNTGG